jgi:acetyl esterase/lipase
MEHSSQIEMLWPEGCVHNGEGSDPPRIEIFQPTERTGESTPAIIVCPGGGYTHRADHEGAPFAEFFARQGMVGIVCHYRVAPNRHPAPYSDVARAIRLVRSKADELNIDPGRIGLMGFSAGGHNACTVATQPDLYRDEYDDQAGRFSARPDRLILAYPVVSFVSFPHQGSALNLLGPAASRRRLRELSGERHVDADTPPTFIFHTVDDPVVPVENSIQFAQAARRAEVPVTLHAYAHGPHGVGMASDDPTLRSWPTLLIDWLKDWQAGD